MIAPVGKAGGALRSEPARNYAIIYITADTCATNFPPFPKEQDPRWLKDQVNAINALRKRAEEDWKRDQELLEEWRRIGERLETARLECEIYFRPPKKLGRGREPKKWDYRRPLRTSRAQQKRPRRR